MAELKQARDTRDEMHGGREQHEDEREVGHLVEVAAIEGAEHGRHDPEDEDERGRDDEKGAQTVRHGRELRQRCRAGRR